MDLKLNDLSILTQEKWNQLMAHAFEFAQCCAESDNNCITSDFAQAKSRMLPGE